MWNQNERVAINPEFKSAASTLKKCAQRELNVQVSIDRLVNESQYRSTVFNELEGLGSEGLDEQIQTIKEIPIYLKSAPVKARSEAFEVAPLNNNRQLTYSGKNPRPYGLFAVIGFAILSIFFIFAWQTGYVQVSGNNQTAISRNATNPVASATTQVAAKMPPRQAVTVDQVRTQPVMASPEPVERIATVLPSDAREVKLRLHGSNTVGEHLAPALLEAYLKSVGISEMLWVQGEHEVERELQFIKDNRAYAIELHAHGSSTGFKDLLAGNADMIMSSRQIKEEEVQSLRPQFGNLGLAGQEYIISLDGLAIIVNRDNPVNTLKADILAKVFSGEINNWKALGGPDIPISLVALDENSGTWDTFNNLVMKPHNQALSSRADRLESSSELSEKVSNDLGAIGFVSLPYLNNSKALSVAASDKALPIYPTSFTVSTEDYPLARRLYMYAPSVGNDMVRQFVKFAVSRTGQEVVEQVGFVSQNIKLETVYKVKDAPKVYNDYTEKAKRLSVNFRFRNGSNKLDSKGKRDLHRLFEYIENNQGRRIVLMGFSDAFGDNKHNTNLSVLRANVLERELISRGMNVSAIEGFGSQLPIASNRNELGRSKNRRVEVWVF